MAISKSLDQAVRTRAHNRCEYCLAPQSASKLRFWIDHIVAEQHAGRTEPENLALACPFCNRHKGPNLSGIDVDSGARVSLFNPRVDSWSVHFRTHGEHIVGITPTGRTTVHVLAMNHPVQLLSRKAVLREGHWPPDVDKERRG